MSALHDQLAELVTDVPVYGDLDQAIARARGEQVRRNRALAALTAAAAVIAVIVSVVALDNGEPKSLPPIAPTTTPSPSTTPTPLAWEPPEPLRAGADRVVSPREDSFGNPLEYPDASDTSPAEIDIQTVMNAELQGGSGSWQFRLAARPARDPADRSIAYGIVVDRDGDHDADCQFGINNDGPEDRDFHVWVTNLNTHETKVGDGPPYGFPIEFSHPAEQKVAGEDLRLMAFSFLTPNPGPCARFGAASTFYVWTSLTEGGRVVARDYAPDAAWLTLKCYDCGQP